MITPIKLTEMLIIWMNFVSGCVYTYFCSSSVVDYFLDQSLSVVQTLEMLEKKEKVLQKKAAAEVERAKEFTRAKNKRGMVAKCFHSYGEFGW